MNRREFLAMGTAGLAVVPIEVGRVLAGRVDGHVVYAPKTNRLESIIYMYAVASLDVEEAAVGIAEATRLIDAELAKVRADMLQALEPAKFAELVDAYGMPIRDYEQDAIAQERRAFSLL